jgi:hypothetical protein
MAMDRSMKVLGMASPLTIFDTGTIRGTGSTCQGRPASTPDFEFKKSKNLIPSKP